jgi:hypothetical protein
LFPKGRATGEIPFTGPSVLQVSWLNVGRAIEDFRQVEAAMLFVDDAARRLAQAADALKQDGAAPHLIAALETGRRIDQGRSQATDDVRLLEGAGTVQPGELPA